MREYQRQALTERVAAILDEPTPPQPEEPTEFGARVVIDGQKFLRAPERDGDRWPWLDQDESTWCDWDDLLRLGRVQVVPDQGWTVPADTPEVPGRIEEWPDNDEALRPYSWRDSSGNTWRWVTSSSKWAAYDESGEYVRSYPRPVYVPWERVTDA